MDPIKNYVVCMTIRKEAYDLWYYFDRFRKHPKCNEEIMHYCFNLYFSSLVYVSSELKFYGLARKIHTVEYDFLECWMDSAYWDMFDDFPESLGQQFTLTEPHADLIEAGNHFITTLINTDVTASILNQMCGVYYIVEHLSFSCTDMLDGSSNLVFSLTLN